MDLTQADTATAVATAPFPASDRGLSRLTPRERQVIWLVSCGETSKSIGRKLGISFRTVEAHRAHIMAKLNVRGLAELVHLTIGEWPELERAAPRDLEDRQQALRMTTDPMPGEEMRERPGLTAQRPQ